MDNKGIFSIDFIFTITFTLIIALFLLNLGENNVKTSINLEENIESRLILDKIANSINQINSNGEGYSLIIQTPNNISGKSYNLLIKNKNITLEIENKKGMSLLIPIRLVDNNGIDIYEKKLYSGQDYLIKKIDEGKINIREC